MMCVHQCYTAVGMEKLCRDCASSVVLIDCAKQPGVVLGILYVREYPIQLFYMGSLLDPLIP